MEQIISQRPNGARRVILKLAKGSHVEQHHRDRSDIKSIMRKYHKSGVLPMVQSPGTYGDFTGIEDFQDAQNRIIQANEDFMLLPSEVRAQFDHDPGKLLDYVNDPQNRAECVEMGLIPPEVPKHVSTKKTSQKGTQSPTKETAPSKEAVKPPESAASD